MKKLTLISLLLIFGLLLVACGGAEAPAEVVEEAEEAMEEAAEEVGAAAEEAAEEVGGAIVASEEEVTEEEVMEVAEVHEAPMLAEMVAAGELPPLEERLPVDVKVVTPVDGVGEYGGTWHNVTWAQDIANIKMVLYDPPVRWKADYTGYEPGLAKAFEVSDDGLTITWRFREGVKWSDGAPFTMEDMRFWWEDLATNEDFKVVTVPWWGFKSDGEPMDVEFPDDYTMVMTWDRPQYITTYIVAQGFWEWEPLMRPKHYLSQFHPDYTDGMTYEDLELHTTNGFVNVEGYPCLMAWCLETFTPGERVTLVRNPYYWKVDTEGNQLPYIDRLDIAIVPDAEVRVLEGAQGKYEASFRGHTDDPNNFPFLAEQAETGGYEFIEGSVNGAGGWPCWLINQDYPGTTENPSDVDLEIGEVLRDVNFRKGLSHAMNRERLIDVAWGGIGTPQQATISPQAWHFASAEGQEVLKEWQEADASYDPDLAAELFEAAGVVDQDGDGLRDLPSGEPFQLVLDLGNWGTELVSTNGTESFAADLEAAGFDVLINGLFDTPDWELRQIEGLYMLRNCHASELDIWTYPDWIFPLRDNRAWPMEGKWRQTGGEEGWEPTGAAKALQDIYDEGLATPTIQGRHELVWDAIQIHIEQGPFTLGAAGDQAMPSIAKPGFNGIPDLVILGPWAPGSPGNLYPEQFWMDADLRAESLGE